MSIEGAPRGHSAPQEHSASQQEGNAATFRTRESAQTELVKRFYHLEKEDENNSNTNKLAMTWFREHAADFAIVWNEVAKEHSEKIEDYQNHPEPLLKLLEEKLYHPQHKYH